MLHCLGTPILFEKCYFKISNKAVDWMSTIAEPLPIHSQGQVTYKLLRKMQLAVFSKVFIITKNYKKKLLKKAIMLRFFKSECFFTSLMDHRSVLPTDTPLASGRFARF